MQTIPPDWQDKISLHIVSLERAAAASEDDNSQELWDASESLIGHIVSVFGSPEQFAQFLKLDARKKASACGISTQEVDRRLAWERSAARMTYVELAEKISSFYRDRYEDTLQDISYMRDFRRPVDLENADFH